MNKCEIENINLIWYFIFPPLLEYLHRLELNLNITTIPKAMRHERTGGQIKDDLPFDKNSSNICGTTGAITGGIDKRFSSMPIKFIIPAYKNEIYYQKLFVKQQG